MLQEQFSEFHKYCADLGLKPSSGKALVEYWYLTHGEQQNAPQGRYGESEWGEELI